MLFGCGVFKLLEWFRALAFGSGGKVFGCGLGFGVERFWIGMKILGFG